jgi:hypothetical protein
VSSVEFELRQGEDQYLIWGITQDADGKWGLTSLGGCWPAAPDLRAAVGTISRAVVDRPS